MIRFNFYNTNNNKRGEGVAGRQSRMAAFEGTSKNYKNRTQRDNKLSNYDI